MQQLIPSFQCLWQVDELIIKVDPSQRCDTLNCQFLLVHWEALDVTPGSVHGGRHKNLKLGTSAVHWAHSRLSGWRRQNP